jgi:hypothetical protein
VVVIAADWRAEIEAGVGGDVAGEADQATEVELHAGPSRYRDQVTHSLGLLSSTWESLHKTWQATEKRATYGSPKLAVALAGWAEALKKQRDQVGVKMTAELKQHALWPWLFKHPGVRGVHVARVISMIGDPLRFPGRLCVAGHHAAEDQAGTCAQKVERSGKWEPCGLPLCEIRPGTGVRSLWHYLGLHVVEGRLARKRKGHQATWNPAGRTALLQPDGVADQIIKLRVAPWRAIYDATKARVAAERGAEVYGESEKRSDLPSPAALVQEGRADLRVETERRGGPALEVNGGSVAKERASGDFIGRAAVVLESESGPGSAAFLRESEERDGRADLAVETDHWNGSALEGSEGDIAARREIAPGTVVTLRPIQIHQIARTVAVKAFVADLLTEWKRAVKAEAEG